MESHIHNLLSSFKEEIEQISTLATLDVLRTKYQGKKGALQQLMQELKNVSAEDRPKVGKWINDAKETIAELITKKFTQLEAEELKQRLLQEKIDVTLPARKPFPGGYHPIQQMLDRIMEVLTSMGFVVQDGPSVDSDFYNFEALNFAEDHPARDMQDTFYLNNGSLLRTHTSNVQIRVMQNNKPPIRTISYGKCFRNEDVSARSHVIFHQVEALYIDKNVTFGDLLSTFETFIQKLFGPSMQIRIRPSYFPFVEPGAEIDIHCVICRGEGCSICKHSGWLEIAGAGMIHPNVLQHGGIDSETYSGFAWGLGIERLVMIQHNIKDIRLFMENDLRFLNTFKSCSCS